MRNLGFMEILLIGIAVLLLFGAKRLPEIGSSMGKGIREFKRSISGLDDAITGPDDTAAPRVGDGTGAAGSGTGTGSAPARPSGDPKRLSQ